MDSNILYDRQRTIKLKKYNEVLIIGLGGVGNLTAIKVALTGNIKTLHLVDPEEVETSNLNRTLYREGDIGMPKVEATCDLILERRECNLIPYISKVGEVDEECFSNVDVVIDCRDDSTPLPEYLRDRAVINGGYNGTQVTMHINPQEDTTFGKAGLSPYTIVPSCAVSPDLISHAIFNYLTLNKQTDEELINTFDVSDVTKQLMTI